MGYATERFARRLRQLREAAGLTQEQFAKELKVSRGAISYYEKGERTPDIEFLNSLYDYFDCELPFDFLLGETDNHKEEHKNMFEFYGLTDHACEYLKKDTHIGEIISTVLEDKNFCGFMRLYKNIIQNCGNSHRGEIEYMSFLMTKVLNGIIEDALYRNLNLQYTEEEKKNMEEMLIETEKCLENFKTVENILIRGEEDLKNLNYTEKIHIKI